MVMSWQRYQLSAIVIQSLKEGLNYHTYYIVIVYMSFIFYFFYCLTLSLLIPLCPLRKIKSDQDKMSLKGKFQKASLENIFQT